MNLGSLFQSVSEHPEPINIPVEGNLPEWLDGTYYAVGGGLWDLPGGFTMKHFFDGFCILHSFRLSAHGKEIIVRSKFLESTSYKKALAQGKPVTNEFGTVGFPDSDKGLLSRLMSQLLPVNLTDNNNLNLVIYQGNMFAVCQSCFIHQINPDTLESIQKLDLKNILGFPLFCGLPLYENDCTFSVAFSVSATLKSNIIRFPAVPFNHQNEYKEDHKITTDSVKILASIPSRWKVSFSFLHTFALSENYFILVDQPLLINNFKILMSQIQNQTIQEIMDWQPHEKMIFNLLNRLTGEKTKTKYVASSLFILAIINAYEENNHLILDVIGRQTIQFFDKLLIKSLRQNEYPPNDPPQLYRFVLPIIDNFSTIPIKENLVKLKENKATAERVDDIIFCTPVAIGKPGFDLPTINKTFTGKKYRYVYGTGYFEEGFYRRAVCKVNLITEETILMRVEESQYLSEPLFIQRPDGAAEDDGIVIVTMVDTRPDFPSAIIFLDGSSFKEIGRAKIPYKIAFINHGLFIKSHV